MHREYKRILPGCPGAVLFVHGIVGSPCHFEAFLPLVPEAWSVCNLLLAGHGAGVKDFGNASMEEWKLQVRQALAELLRCTDRVYIAAHSMGTLFAIQAAIDHPERVKGLFLLAVPLRPFVSFRAIRASVKLGLGFGEKDPVARDMRRDSSVTLEGPLWDYARWIPRFWELLAECRRIEGLLPRLKVKTLACHSRRDELVSGRSGEILAGNPYVELTVLEHSSHFSYGPEDLKLLCGRFQRLLGIK